MLYKFNQSSASHIICVRVNDIERKKDINNIFVENSWVIVNKIVCSLVFKKLCFFLFFASTRHSSHIVSSAWLLMKKCLINVRDIVVENESKFAIFRHDCWWMKRCLRSRCGHLPIKMITSKSCVIARVDGRIRPWAPS